MRAEEQFDSFYLKTRRALVHQTFALTGDLAAADRAVRDSYVSAWHHWRKVKTHDDPRDWVRPRAWAQAQRRHTARLWQRTRTLSAQDRAVLDALHKLPVAERRALLMAELAGVPVDVAARELNVTQETLQNQHRSAAAGFADSLGIEPSSVRGALMSLGGAAAKVSLPRAAAIRREGRARRRTHTLTAAAAATFLAVGTGAFAHEPAGETTGAGSPVAAPEAEPTQRGLPEEDSGLPSADDLLEPEDVSRLDPKGRWLVADTHDNTSGEGINYVCQQERFADPEGLATVVRELKTSGDRAVRSVVQSVEISDSDDDAAASYSTVLSWFAGCEGGEVHLRRAFDVAGVGARGAILELDSWTKPRTTYSVAVAQVGQVVTTSVVKADSGSAPRLVAVGKLLAAAGRAICERAGGTDCTGRPGLEPTRPAPSGEATGILASVDIPPLVGVVQPWVGTEPAPTASGPEWAPSKCGRVDFRRAGAVGGRTRTFLVPDARLPDRFGLTATYGTFKTVKAAAGFMRDVRKGFAGCEDRDLATEVEPPASLREGRLDGSTWRLHTELSESREVVYDVGFVRRGNFVAKLTFIPAEDGADLPQGAFRALVVRAGQRLAELG